MGILINRRRFSKKDGLVVTTSLIANNLRISGNSGDEPIYSSSSNYCVIEINLSKAITGVISMHQGLQNSSNPSFILFYNGDTYRSRGSSSTDPRSFTITRPFNRILMSIYKDNKESTYIKQDGKFVWDGSKAKEDWKQWGI